MSLTLFLHGLGADIPEAEIIAELKAVNEELENEVYHLTCTNEDLEIANSSLEDDCVYAEYENSDLKRELADLHTEISKLHNLVDTHDKEIGNVTG